MAWTPRKQQLNANRGFEQTGVRADDGKHFIDDIVFTFMRKSAVGGMLEPRRFE